MKLYVINKEIGGPWQYNVKPIHSIFYHGEVLGSKQELLCNYSDRKNAMLLRKNIYSMPGIFTPFGNFVIIKDIAESLKSIPNVRILPVEFGVLYNIPYHANDFSISEKFSTGEKWESYSNCIDHRPEYSKSIGEYKELVTFKYHEFFSEFSGQRLKKISVDFGPGSIDDILDMEVNEKMIQAYPVFGHGYIFCADHVFELISGWLDWNYYRYIEISF